MKRFYINSADPEADVRRCHESRDTQRRITISGEAETGGIEAFTGIVQAVEDRGESAPPEWRWRVTILD
jgi:hypothetical protein